LPKISNAEKGKIVIKRHNPKISQIGQCFGCNNPIWNFVPLD